MAQRLTLVQCKQTCSSEVALHDNGPLLVKSTRSAVGEHVAASLPRHRAALRVGMVTLVAALVGTQGSASAQLRGEKPEVVKVNDRVYCATGYALGNSICVVTDDSLVIIDTTESPQAARDILAAFRKISPLPIQHIIYTHFHGDHINGTRMLAENKPKIIAQALHMPELMKYQLLAAYNQRLNTVQWGAMLPAERRGISLAIDPRNIERAYMPPTETFDAEHKFEQGGVRFELYHAQGETVDHLFVWLPELETLCPGDLVYPSFPMLASPMKPDRPVLTWAESVERMRKFRPKHLVGSHGLPLSGADRVDVVLERYSRAIRFVHDETVKGLNAGLSLDEIRRCTRLPEHLAAEPYLAPLYGRLEWGINGVYRQYTGWYDFNPAHLNPGPPQEFYRALAEASSVEVILSRAQRALDEKQPQLALELTDVVLGAEPDNLSCHVLRAVALESLATSAVNTVERNIYRGAAQSHKEKASAAAANSRR